MENTKQKCTEMARVTLPWADKIVNYCPVHANQLVMFGNAMGHTIQAQLLPSNVIHECENTTPLTEEEKELSKQFNL